MLSKLSIDNYALIDKSVIDFKPGFSVITGETGSGKSIMLDALSLLMGARADSKAMANKERKMVAEAIFTFPSPQLQNICEAHDIEWDPNEIIIRREISTNGKSRAFVNDTPVNLPTLTEIASHLIDIHSQHKNSLLNQPAQQLRIIDAFGKTEKLQENYRKVFKKYVKLRNTLKKIKEEIEKKKENREFIIFRLEQLEKLKPKRGEFAKLEREAEILGDADKIKSDLTEAYSILGEGPSSSLRMLQVASSKVGDIDLDLFDPDNKENLAERLEAIKIELRDIADTLESYAEKINADPQRLSKVESRISAINDAIKRLKVKDEDELVDLYETLKREYREINGDGQDLSEMEAELKELASELKERAGILSEARSEAAKNFAEVMMEKIRPLGMQNVKFEVDIKRGKMSADGQDITTFYCSFNKNHPMQPVSEIASGGEISRVMLGIKSVMSENMELPTVIFDEIDTGVSGEIAHKMGQMMKEMSAGKQILAVTHLPQVAALGDSHFKVYKDDDDEKTVSHIMPVVGESRVREIAGMLSGTEINEVSMENARMLLNG